MMRQQIGAAIHLGIGVIHAFKAEGGFMRSAGRHSLEPVVQTNLPGKFSGTLLRSLQQRLALFMRHPCQLAERRGWVLAG